MSKRLSRMRRSEQRNLLLMVIPAAVIVLIYRYGPLFGWVMAFQNFNLGKGILGSEFIGIENFQYIFALPNFWNAVRNTFFITSGQLIFGLLVPIVVSILLTELPWIRSKRGIQTMIYLPHFLSWVIVGGIMIEILSPSDGIVNMIIGWFGMDPVFFLGDPGAFPWVLIFSDVWKEFGFGTIIYMAALISINPNLYEAAAIDGASRLQRIRLITLPSILPIIVVIATLRLGTLLNYGFEQVFTLYNSAVYSTGDIIDTLAYRVGLQDYLFDLATAIGMFKSLISITMVSLTYTIAYKWLNYRIF